MNNEKKECTITWFIENYSYCWHENGVALISPEFTADCLKDTSWFLRIYPRGCGDGNKSFISLGLHRSTSDDGPEEFPIKYEMSFLSADGSTLRSKEWGATFTRGEGYGPLQIIRMDDILLRKKADYIPQDNLSVRCKLWTGEGDVQQIKQIVARTRIGIEGISFLHVTENFSSLVPNQKKTNQIRSASKKGLVVSSSLYFTDGSCCEGKIMIEITPTAAKQILSKCKLSLIDGSGKEIECGKADNRFDATRKDIQKLPLSLTRQAVLNRKSEYLPDDKLTLLCTCTFSTGVEYEKIESTVNTIPIVASNQINGNGQNKDIFNTTEKLSACSSALDDLKEIYSDQFFTDVELKTKTKSFPAHKILLCARSPVFKAMMTNDMKEKKSNSIQVDDLEDDIVQQLLLFLYSDSLENLQWQSAIKLYYAADKYAVEKLKMICSAFLVDNVTPSFVSELLLLADAHNDSNLKIAVEDFILQHEKQVYGSDEWESLIETNPKLVSKTMLLIHKRKI
ncbi:Speckle-type POZ protein [Araneus ventricosus]|uniref:Speckle-type POZ protein n=1 Tax=Araneus ventricosus TaxID=182803 RepID=A0A4Y2QZ62_ARAVE|nr:Speckle-type POZ protein [Araneus ventricosus]